MPDIKDDEIDVNELMLRIRREAERRKSADAAPASNGSSQASYALLRERERVPEPFSPAVALQPGSQNRYQLWELLKYYDREFVENAYRVVLKREPDQTGLLQYLEGLRGGRVSRVDVLHRLRTSAEGREKNVQIEGLAWRAQLRRLYRLPFVGYLFEWLVELARLPLFIRSQRRFHGYSQVRSERVVARLNQLIEESHDYFQKLREDMDRLAEIEEKRSLALRDELQRLSRAFEERVSGIKGELEAEAAQLRAEAAAQRQATEEQLRSQNDLFKTETERLERDSASLRAEALKLKERDEEFARRLQTTRTELVAQERRSHLLLEEARRLASLSSAPEEEGAAIREEALHFHDAFYSSFEEHFRGSREEIIERLQVYLPVLERSGVTGDVLDIGCGRGEWLETLKSAGLRARGIDTNRVQVEWCRELGLEAEEAEALEYLRRLPDESLMAVTSFHVVEHLEFDALLALMNEIMRVLKPGGLVIFETPNPENVSVASHNFYVDPTHRHPLPIPMMKFLFETRGLYPVEIIRLHPSETPRVEGNTDLIERFNEYFYGPMDYAIIGHKA